MKPEDTTGWTRFKTTKGFDVVLYPNSYIDRVVLKEGFYESEVLETLLLEADAKSIFWDIGSNIGLHSLGFKYHNPQALVFSFEPDFINFYRLYQNCLLNKLEIELLNIALSDQWECTRLFREYRNHGRSTLLPLDKEGRMEKENYVASVPGDFLVSNQILKPPTIIKIDVEGYELKVILGLIETIRKKNIKKIIFEAPSNFTKIESELKTILIEEGYKFEMLKRNEATHHNLDNFLAYL